MHKVFGIILIVVGLVAIMKALPSSSGFEALGAIIGVFIVTFLPAYFKPRKRNQNNFCITELFITVEA